MNKLDFGIFSLSLVSPFFAQAAEPVEDGNEKKPNVVLIYADDLGFGDLECYGARGVKTPNVNRLANDGLRFTNAHAVASTSTPSRYSLLTGEYPWRKPSLCRKTSRWTTTLNINNNQWKLCHNCQTHSLALE